MNLKNPLEPRGYTGFGDGYYCPVAAWLQDTLCQTRGFPADIVKDPRQNAVLALNSMGHFGPGMWADAEGGLISTGCIDAPV